MVKNTRKKQLHVSTLQDVARDAEVSTATVSRCLNSPNQVAKATRTRVMEAVSRLEYTPNFGAKAMAENRTFTIGAIIPTMENAVFARGLQAFQDTLHKRGYTLLVASSSYSSDLEQEQMRTLISRGVDGLLLIGHDRHASALQYLEKRNIPTLVTWAYEPAAALPSIGFDNYAAMQSLADRVFQLGHKNIGMISAQIKSNDRARARVLAVQDMMTNNGLDKAHLKLIETEYDIEKGAIAFETLIKNSDPPTMIFCGNDVLAVGAIRSAHKLGLNVPKDVSITGFDDIELAKIVIPELTTVHVPHQEMGNKAAVALVDMVENKSSPLLKPLEAIVKFRNSLAAV